MAVAAVSSSHRSHRTGLIMIPTIGERELLSPGPVVMCVIVVQLQLVAINKSTGLRRRQGAQARSHTNGPRREASCPSFRTAIQRVRNQITLLNTVTTNGGDRSRSRCARHANCHLLFLAGHTTCFACFLLMTALPHTPYPCQLLCFTCFAAAIAKKTSLKNNKPARVC